ncbi:hydroxymethylbilane synthase [Arsenicicoccus dermatophilus]|uniref:hydroxymethylbilane synthase n=1 Tax=Arsenicicoccus dermatophilus TaxID=1076331 RepID=UPI001F4D104B|nr:hydroxymethylbilane synthase [Arsenicicoccus dermatophilus]MCH8613869.1 hydroxymethylbilane synthase [Arsenicicoccus dermatophilus]
MSDQTTSTIRLGTRRSALATTQSGWVAGRLRELGLEVELVEITTEGDTNAAPLTTIGGTGVFASAIRDALLAGQIDCAVHSLKDLPSAPHPGLVIAAVPAREDVRDALCARDGLTLGELPEGAVVGTGSPRRAAQIAALGLGLELVPIRGNVDTRLQHVRDGRCDAVVLAMAGLRRLDRTELVTEALDPVQVLPAAGQGALALECRDDHPLRATFARLDDPETRARVEAERSLLATLEAGCTAPVGALAEVVESEDGVELSLRAFVGAVDGSEGLRRSLTGPYADPAELGRRLATLLLEDGAPGLGGAGDVSPPRLGMPSAVGETAPWVTPTITDTRA